MVHNRECAMASTTNPVPFAGGGKYISSVTQMTDAELMRAFAGVGSQYSITAEVPPDATAVGVGFVVDGKGKMWVDLDSVRIDVVHDETGKEGL